MFCGFRPARYRDPPNRPGTPKTTGVLPFFRPAGANSFAPASRRGSPIRDGGFEQKIMRFSA